MHAADVAATLLAAAGLPAAALPASAVDSISMWDAIVATAHAGHTPPEGGPRTFLAHHITAYTGGGKIRNGSWNFYSGLPTTPASWAATSCDPVPDGWAGMPTQQHPAGPEEAPSAPVNCSHSHPCLFDLTADVAERHDVATLYPVRG